MFRLRCMFETLVDEMLGWPTSTLDAELREIELAHRTLEARRAACLTACEARQVGDTDGHRSLNAYVRATTNQPGVDTQIARARFCRAYPAAGDALAAGHIGLAQLDTLARLAAHPRVGVLVDTDLIAGFLDHGEHFPYRDFKQLVDRWLMLADQDGALRDVADDLARRTASIHNVDGTLHVHVAGGDPLTTERIKLIFDRACEAEHQHDLDTRRVEFGDDAEHRPLPRTDWQRRYDAFITIFDTANAHLDPPAHPPTRASTCSSTKPPCTTRSPTPESCCPTATSTTPPTLTSPPNSAKRYWSNCATPQQILNRRCETASGQPVHPALVTRALLGGHIRTVLVNSRREIVEISNGRRLFTGVWAIAAHLTHPRCEHPGCELPGHLCDTDHRTPWSAGGPTAQPNSAIECNTHNRLKHSKRWQTIRASNHRLITIRPDGTLILPTGERPPPLHTHVA